MIVLLVSCDQYDSNADAQMPKRSIANRTITQDDIRFLNQLADMAITPSSTGNNFDTYMYWASVNNWTIQYKGFFNRANAIEIMNNNLMENIAFAKANLDFSTGESDALDGLISKITDSNSQEAFSDAIA